MRYSVKEYCEERFKILNQSKAIGIELQSHPLMLNFYKNYLRLHWRDIMLNKFKTCLDTKYIVVENDGSYALSRTGDKLTIYFEESNGHVDWKNNFDFPAKPYRNMKNTWFCHRGFLKVWKSIEPHIMADIMDLTVNEIEIVGYSHGGAIAQLCYEYVKFNRPDVKASGYGFGAPRVFWGFARKAVRDRFKGFMVVRNGKDLVTHVPPALFGFRHICDVIEIGESVGLIKDHYPDRYILGLTDWENGNI